MLRGLVALVTLTAVTASGCGGRTWPSTAASVADPAFVARDREVVTVDILPFDLALGIEPGARVEPGELRSRAETRIMNATIDGLTRRAYGIGGLIDWNGQAAGSDVLTRADLLATVEALGSYGVTADPDPGAPPLALPATLGHTTGADATLYVGGWAYVPAHRESTGSKVAKGIAIAIVAVTVVVILIAITRSDKKGSSSSKSSGRTPRVGGAAIRDHREEAISEVRDHRGATPTVRDHRDGRSVRLIRDHRASDAPRLPTLRPGGHRTVTDVALDLWSGPDGEIEVDPDWRARQPGPRPGKDAQLYLQMTLVDNRTQTVLWHAHQVFPANAGKAADAERAARLLLSTLPAR